MTGFYLASLPTIYDSSSVWTTSPTYFAIRIGVILVLLGMISAILPIGRWIPRPFAVAERFGRYSLFIYWIHVELVYGYATWGIHRRLPIWGAGLAYALFCVLMFWAVALRDQLILLWRGGRRPALQAVVTSLKVE